MSLADRFLLMGVVVLNSIAFALGGMAVSTHPTPWLFDLMALNAAFVLYAGVVAVQEMEPYEDDDCDDCVCDVGDHGHPNTLFEEWYPEEETGETA